MPPLCRRRAGSTARDRRDGTTPDAPTPMARLDSAGLPGAGQRWSTPTPPRLDSLGAVQNTEKMVLIFGGGYDTTQDNSSGSTDTQGNAIYIVDSVSGTLLWHASDSGSDRNLSKMEYSIPSDIRVIDIDSDQFADRMYVADMGGQIWRFDIANGAPVSSLITGGLIPQLGGAPQDPPPSEPTRRSTYPPDIDLLHDSRHNVLPIDTCSRHRQHPHRPPRPRPGRWRQQDRRPPHPGRRSTGALGLQRHRADPHRAQRTRRLRRRLRSRHAGGLNRTPLPIQENSARPARP